MFRDWEELGKGPVLAKGAVTVHVEYRDSRVVTLRLYMSLFTNSIALSVSLTQSHITPESIFGGSMPPFVLWTFVGRVDIVYISPGEEILATLRKKQEPRKKPETKRDRKAI